MAKLIRITQVNEETVIFTYGIQFFCAHNFGHRHKQKFMHFKEDITAKRKIQLGDILIAARKWEVTIVSAGRK